MVFDQKNNMNKFYTLILISIFSSFTLLAQDEDGKKVVKKNAKVLIVDDIVEEDDNVNNSFSGDKNVVKLQLLDFIKGYALVSFTRSLNSSFSAEISYGSVFFPEFLKQFTEAESGYSQGITANSQFYYPVVNSTNTTNYNFLPGRIFRLGLRYFYNNDYFNDGSYLGIEYGRINFQYNTSNGTGDRTPFLKSRTTDLRLYWGKQTPFWDSKFYYDFNVSAGIGFRTNDYIYYEYGAQGTFQGIDSNKSKIFTGETYNIYRFSIGFAIGYGF